MKTVVGLFIALSFLWMYSVSNLVSLYRGKYSAHPMRVALVLLFFGVYALGTTTYSFWGAASSKPTDSTDVLIFMFMFAVAVGCAITAVTVPFGPSLTKKFTQNWVKAIDFLYLAITFFGISIVVAGLAKTTGEAHSAWQKISQLCVSAGLGVRLSKTLIELFFSRHIQTDYVPPARKNLQL